MKIRRPDFSDSPANREHAALGLPPVEDTRQFWQTKRFIAASLILLAGALWFTLSRLPAGQRTYLASGIEAVLTSPAFWMAVAVGFAAQAIDGALGMAYGISSTTFLIGTGASPAAASGAVHIAEVFTTGFSGAAHLKLGNVDKRLFWRLVVPGVLGGVAGAWLLTSIDGALIKPFIAAYLLFMGLYILRKAWRGRVERKQSAEIKHVSKLAVTGGFVDAVGGGGWGPVVTSSLVGRGSDPRTTIGTVNSAEFFIALATGGAFILFGDVEHWLLVAGLVVGGMFAAPFAALLTARLPARTLLTLVGVLITLLSAFNLYKAL
ncbi:sulfite exporter TauE/SafE family protein [Chitinibacteraceae bacterium HSL-7]